MKKLLVLSVAVVMVLAFTLPASAFESVFGGYWRVRAFTQQNFDGDSDIRREDGGNDLSRTDTRTRLYYTAVLNDNLKFVNQFEFDAVFGGSGDYGDIGADGVNVEIRSSYVDATMGAVRMTLGVQSLELGRGQIISDQMAGVILSTKFGDTLVPFTWFKVNEGGTGVNSEDSDVFALYPVFNFGENFSLNPFIAYGYSRDGTRAGANIFSTYGANANTDPDFAVDDGIGVYWLGVNADATLGAFNLWATAIYVGGELESQDASDVDVKAWTAMVGASVPLGPASLHGQFLYASGDDDEDDADYEAYFGVDGAGAGWSYYWAEIMGNGRFDAQASAGSNANPSNLWFANIGASIKPMEKLKLTGDLYYAAHVEDDFTTDEKNLGVEVDLVATYQLVEGLNIDLVGAYLFADDATAVDDQGNEDDPWEVGTRLSISF
jgi:hypothetical protein